MTDFALVMQVGQHTFELFEHINRFIFAQRAVLFDISAKAEAFTKL